jgi:hypothetical protein
VTLSDLSYEVTDAIIDVLDVATRSVVRLSVPRAELLRRYGHLDPGLNIPVPPMGELVAYTPTRAALLLGASDLGPRAAWYVEVDPRTHKLGRQVAFGSLGADDRVTILGVDPSTDDAWFAVDRRGAHGHELVMRKLDRGSLAITDVMTLRLPARMPMTGYEDVLEIHAAPDFSRFAAVEYEEDGLPLAPRAAVYVLEPATQTSFSVPALSTTYGVAFSRDGAYLYLGSSQHGTIARVDLAARKIDKRVPGPTLLHFLTISPDGKHLFALATSGNYVVYDLPSLGGRTDKPHDPALAPAFQQLFGGGGFTPDGRHVVLEAELPPLPPVNTPLPANQDYLITRVRD